VKILGQGRSDLDVPVGVTVRAPTWRQAPQFPICPDVRSQTERGPVRSCNPVESQAKYIRQAITGLRRGHAVAVRTESRDRLRPQKRSRFCRRGVAKVASWSARPTAGVNERPAHSISIPTRRRRYDAANIAASKKPRRGHRVNTIVVTGVGSGHQQHPELCARVVLGLKHQTEQVTVAVRPETHRDRGSR